MNFIRYEIILFVLNLLTLAVTSAVHKVEKLLLLESQENTQFFIPSDNDRPQNAHALDT
jgi:hypothetical protein